jgi:hypothetical protein
MARNAFCHTAITRESGGGDFPKLESDSITAATAIHARKW